MVFSVSREGRNCVSRVPWGRPRAAEGVHEGDSGQAPAAVRRADGSGVFMCVLGIPASC